MSKARLTLQGLPHADADMAFGKDYLDTKNNCNILDVHDRCITKICKMANHIHRYNVKNMLKI